jgi:hypothetical protein
MDSLLTWCSKKFFVPIRSDNVISGTLTPQNDGSKQLKPIKPLIEEINFFFDYANKIEAQSCQIYVIS